MSGQYEVVQTIKDRIRLSEVVAPYVQLKPNGGGRFVGLCPFHTEKTPSFHVNDDAGFYKCFGCGKSGDVFSFLMEKENYSFPDALKRLAQQAGVALQPVSTVLSPSEKKKNEFLDLYARVANSFSDILLNKPEASHARQYLASRNLTLETIVQFQLGYVPDRRQWLWDFLKKKNYSDEFLQESGLFSQKGSRYCLFTGRLVFPIKNKAGQVIAFSGRLLKQNPAKELPKYINSPETLIYQKREALFGIHTAHPFIRREGCVYIVEGNFDVISMYQAGIPNTVAPLGTAFTEQQAAILRPYARQFICLFDSDSAGRNAAVKALFLLQRLHLPASVVQIPDGKDPSDQLMSEGGAGLEKTIKNRQNALDFLINMGILKYGKERFEQKQQVIHFILPFIHLYESEVQKNEALRFVANRLNIDFISLEKDALRDGESHIGKDMETKAAPLPSAVQKTILPQDELLLLVAAAKKKEYFQEVKAQLLPDDFRSSHAKDLYEAMDFCDRQETFSAGSIAERLSDPALREQVGIWLNDEAFIQNPRQTLTDILYRLRIARLEAKKQALISDAALFGATLHLDPDLHIAEEIQIINQEIQKIREIHRGC